MEATLQGTSTKVLQSAITTAVSQLRVEASAIKTIPVQVDDRSGFKQTGSIDAGRVRSIVMDICAETAQPLPETFHLFLPGNGTRSMSPEALTTLVAHMTEVARAL